ncbi:MAG: valine--tRNA ligase [Sphingorhabdus sp.]|uniref:valine--tRNA ligase n=1 Tax=Sphingorhabdus sp. TaxID=1902408 RepID=UPI0025E120CE|nr:valine--tRNA ligase [Sphingorhabdus sp.]MCO4090439.1 valine--tRNA ligase [Sphingorhabdus sp.]
MTIDKTFDPAAIEAKWYAHWESTGAFRPDRPHAEPYTIVNPPPNVTGSLHIGHALDNTLQDILIRHARLQGKDALWVVGMDHAGIATQMVVERQLNAQGQKRTDFTRDEFVAKVWEWKAESGGEITGQLRRLGCSMDWENERFTMDEGFSKAVIKVFVDLYNQGLLYRDKRLVNWDPGLKTAISDLEVETREINGKFWHFKYPLEDGSGFISVATTRPETMLADMAVAVNPSDERYAHLVGKNVRLPITGRLIPIVTDEHADPELGSGAVKITPGHDFNDFEVGKRAGFKASEMFNMLDGEGRVVQTADGLIPAEYIGQYRFGIEGEPTNARKMVVEAMDALDLLEKVEDRVIQTPFGDRSGQVIEPWLTDQWYVDAATLAKPAIEAARKGKANGGFDIVPKSWEKTYFNWMENIQPWCVSRQLWWGHQIPAWFTADGTCYVAETEEAAQGLAGVGVALTRDPDVLDTWFSSALWPFGTLGWPEENPPPTGEGDHAKHGGGARAESPDGEGGRSLNVPLRQPAAGPPPRSGEESLLQRHYPNDVLISGFDILFFWDARMAMQGIHFMKEVPWKTLYLHGLVRAADGSKMSKSKGNTVDPLGLIDQYGADALRFFMAAMESQGRDIKMDESRVAGYRNFATKLWNAARFAQSNGISGSHSVHAPKAELAVNRWIIGEVVETVDKLNKAFAEYRFDGMADVLYHFVFDQFCDWYLELIKPLVQVRPGEGWGPDAVEAGPQPTLGNADADETREVAGWALDQILVMLHPFMPFITEELWHALSDSEYPRAYDIIHAQWPEPNATVDAEAVAEINWVIDTISKTRSFKAELNIAPGTRLTANIAGPQAATMAIIARQGAALSRLGRIDDFVYSPVETNNVAQIVVGDDTIVFALDGVIDLDAERSRITKAIEAATKERDALSGRLSNAAFVEKAKPEAVEKARADHAEKAAEAERLTAALKRLG